MEIRNMKRNVSLMVLLFVAACFQGCSSITVLRTKELHAVRDSVRLELDAVQKKISDEQLTQSEMLRLIRADLQVRFSELDKKISDLDSRLSENQYRLSKIDEKTGQFQKQLEEKLNADSAQRESKKLEVEKLFQVASSDFSAGRFDIALNGFKDIMVRFSDFPQGQEAQYWIAECWYANKKYSDAEKDYLQYIKDNPQGVKVCTALYKLGLCYEKLNKNKSKELVWKKLIEQFPDSDEAKLVGAERK
jgi:tol-pal system protein YbgF